MNLPSSPGASGAQRPANAHDSADAQDSAVAGLGGPAGRQTARALLGTIAGVLAFLLIAEALCRVLPVSSQTQADYYIDPQILTYAPDLPWRYATGWDLRHPQQLRTNGHGFVSGHAFVRDPRAVVLVGDSYVEAASLDAASRPEAQIERALGGQRPVYAMGAAGTALLDYAERIRYAQQHFGSRDFIVLMERNDVRQALCGSGNVHSQCLDAATLAPRTETVPPTTALKRLLRRSALAQYLVSQLKIVPARLWQQAFGLHGPAAHGVAPLQRDAAAPAARAGLTGLAQAEISAVSQAFFERIRPHVSGTLVIVVDADRPALQHGRPVDDPARRYFITLARAAGATVIDTEPLYRAHFERSALSLDVGPDNGHLNPLGVALVAAEIARKMAQ